ncbi:PucR family transcriptional regulator [Neobacillus sp. SuZ13]|uniref:PucR family transcriptional regulator n=1 Tax=Neobacillus sp. SuZ13 TaxID=3047875 RepID=UPI0024BFF53E|nr:PucR family transcriptional regulator [Neobacillus sp. SuZ13]WHY69391.1 PucR family transcriptional regulator [Neobacillus sp. SuZ13]
MKVNEVLTISHLAGMTIIAGESGTGREVESVNMMDAPDIIPFLHANEFLITTAYHFKDQPYKLIELIQAMAEQSCAGLAIKTKRFLEKVPPEVINLANELAFPIIELPLELSLGEIVNHTLRAILDQRAAELTLALETHKQFTKIIMEGKGIKFLLQDLSQVIRRPVQLIDQHFKPIYQPITNLDFPLILDGLHIPSIMTTPISLSVRSTKQTCTLFPVHISERKKGFLMIIGEIEKTDHLISLTIEQAANVISFAIMKEHALRQQERSKRNDFFLHFSDGTFSSHEEIIGRAAEFSLQNDQRYICAVGKIDRDNHHPSFTERLEKADDIYDFMEGEVSVITPCIHFFTKGETCILLFEIQETLGAPSAYCESTLLHLQEKVSTYFGNTISFGVSHITHTFLDVKKAYKDAVDALAQGQFSKKIAYIQTYHTKDVMELLRMVPHDELKNFYTIVLSRLADTNVEDDQTLLDTLSVYLETHCQISETAKRLYVHRNTVIYRIEKCEEILGKSLKDSETTMQLRVALRIKKSLFP